LANQKCVSLANKSDVNDIVLNLVRRFPQGALHSDVLDWFDREGAGIPLGIACSGGVDSMALLFLLYGHFRNHRAQFIVLHYNHGLRGKESDEDEAFVRDWAARLGLQFHSERNNKQLQDPSEADLRALRHTFFHEKIKRFGGHVLLFGHHREDVAETMLMRLARGSGTAGLAAPRPVHCFNDGYVHLRPLLNLSKEDIKSACLEYNIPWREDSSNQGLAYTRNIVRHRILPQFNKLPPGDALKNIGRSRQLLEEDDSALQSWLHELIAWPTKPAEPLNLAPLQGKPIALYRRALYEWLHVNDLDKYLSARCCDDVLAKIIAGDSAQISAGSNRFVCFDGQYLSARAKEGKTTPAWKEVTLHPGLTEVDLPGSGRVRIETVEVTEVLWSNIKAGLVDPREEAFIIVNEADFPLLLRPWSPGDKYQPLGAPGKRKLQDLFTDKKIPPAHRALLPVFVSSSGQILWVPGFPPVEEKKLFRDSGTALRLTYQTF